MYRYLIKKVYFALLIVFLPSLLVGQKSILLYTDDTPYLFPYMENCLRNMVVRGSDIKLFKEVVNLTRTIENEKDEQVTEDIRAILGQDSLLANQSFSFQKFSLSKRMSEFDYFLRVNYHLIGDVLEVQMYLYEIDKGPVSDEEYLWRIINDSEEYIGVSNVFLNVGSGGYEQVLDNEIKSLFPVSNTPPEIRYYVNEAFNPDTIFASVGDSVFLDLSYSKDRDGNEVNLSFLVEQLGYGRNGNLPDSLKLKFFPDRAQQFLIMEKAVNYKFQVSVFDGVDYSQKKRVVIRAFPRQLIFLPKKKVEFAITEYDLRREHPFSFEVQGVSYNVDLLKHMKFNVERVSSTYLTSREEDIVRVANENGNTILVKSFKYPLNITYDTTHIAGGIRVDGKLKTPRDKINLNTFDYNVWLSFKGIKTNVERLKFDFWKYGNNYVSIGVESGFFSKAPLPVSSSINVVPEVPPFFNGDRKSTISFSPGLFLSIYGRTENRSIWGATFSSSQIGQRDFETIRMDSFPEKSILYFREVVFSNILSFEWLKEVYRSPINNTYVGVGGASFFVESDFFSYENISDEFTTEMAEQFAQSAFDNRKFYNFIARPYFLGITRQRLYRNLFISGRYKAGLLLRGKVYHVFSLGLSVNFGENGSLNLFGNNLIKL